MGSRREGGASCTGRDRGTQKEGRHYYGFLVAVIFLFLLAANMSRRWERRKGPERQGRHQLIIPVGKLRRHPVSDGRTWPTFSSFFAIAHLWFAILHLVIVAPKVGGVLRHDQPTMPQKMSHLFPSPPPPPPPSSSTTTTRPTAAPGAKTGSDKRLGGLNLLTSRGRV